MFLLSRAKSVVPRFQGLFDGFFTYILSVSDVSTFPLRRWPETLETGGRPETYDQ